MADSTKKQFQKVTIDTAVAGTPIAERYEAYARETGAEIVYSDAVGPALHEGHTLTSGKKQVLVTSHKGAAVKECTGLEEHYVCCNLHVMNQTTNCPLDCSYCILQAYINQPITTVHANVAEMMDQVEAQCEAQPGRLFRIGTGDLGDALALDPLGGVTAELIPRFSRLPNAVLELKTKSNAVDQLMDLQHNGRVVIAWSMNARHVVDTEEHRCASIDERLEAAKKVIAAGYPVAFHFDPMVVHDGWERGYAEVIQAIAEAIPAEHIAWMSMGALRFPPAMQKKMAERFPNSTLRLGEMLIGHDGKMRYLKPQRLAMYQHLFGQIREQLGEDIFVYLCMENQELWRRTFGYVPTSNNDLDYRFSCSVVRRFPTMLEHEPRWDDYRGAVNLNSGNGVVRPSAPVDASPESTSGAAVR
ncbi:MAG: hypothetical protein KC561_03070 [Myxococcales bacterium]|nr:hypothetical protein [Myxococcales bacterium]